MYKISADVEVVKVVLEERRDLDAIYYLKTASENRGQNEPLRSTRQSSSLLDRSGSQWQDVHSALREEDGRPWDEDGLECARNADTQKSGCPRKTLQIHPES